MKKNTHSFTRLINISDIKNNYKNYISANFRGKELKSILSKSAASVTGIIALKQAVRQLLLNIDNKLDTSEKNIIISHTKEGAPYISGINPLSTFVDLKQYRNYPIKVSISHTKIWACGLAAIQVEKK